MNEICLFFRIFIQRTLTFSFFVCVLRDKFPQAHAHTRECAGICEGTIYCFVLISRSFKGGFLLLSTSHLLVFFFVILT